MGIFSAEDVQPLKGLLLEAKRVVITSHHNPDGDAVGSLLGLHHVLMALGVESHMLLPNDFPKFLAWLPGSKRIVNHFYQKRRAEALIAQADLLFALDYNGLSRLEALEGAFRAARAPKVLIDHHPDPEDVFHLQFARIQVSSTAELVYEVIGAMGYRGLIGTAAAECLLAGIVTDTGSFSHGCSRPRTFQIVSELIEQGAGLERVHRSIYSNYTEQRMRLLGYAIHQKMRVFPQHRAAYIALTRQELKDFAHRIGDTEGLVNYPLAIQGMVLSVLLIENEGYVKVSMRSVGSFPVNRVCQLHFKGGGHQNASGGKAYLSLAATEQRIEELMELYHPELNAQP